MNETPEQLLERLCRGADERRVVSLRVVHAVCLRLRDDGLRSFTRKTVGRLSHTEGGPGGRAIVNPDGASYRLLIDAHRAAAGRPESARRSRADDDGLLTGIQDSGQRRQIELLRDEATALRAEVIALQHAIRKTGVVTVESANSGAAIPEARVGHRAMVNLLPYEREALREALDPKRLAAVKLVVDARGRILFDGHTLFPPAFATALAKIATEFGAAVPENPRDFQSRDVTDARS